MKHPHKCSACGKVFDCYQERRDQCFYPMFCDTCGATGSAPLFKDHTKAEQPTGIIDTTQDQVIALKDGFYAVVDHKLYGPWAMKEYAMAGLQVEQRRIRSKGICRSRPVSDILLNTKKDMAHDRNSNVGRNGQTCV